MLTKIEIDGFKTFEKFRLNLSPFVVVLGPNASGKSNLFDCIQFLSRLASGDLRSAVQGLRGEPIELFRKDADGKPTNQIKLAAEVLLNPNYRDPWGSEVEISHSRLRYEIAIQRFEERTGIERIKVVSESVSPIFAGSDPLKSSKWLDKAAASRYLKYGRRVPWLSTDEAPSTRVFRIHQDGKAGRDRPAHAADASVLSSITSAEFPHLFALREELRSFRFLQLDPMMLRKPSSTTAPELLEPDGSNLPTVLARIKAETSTQTRPKGILADISADLVSIIPGVLDVDVTLDERVREYRVDIVMREGLSYSSRVISDGTLRVLALLTMLHDPKHQGFVCFEEPENGIHPARLKDLVRHLKKLTNEPLRYGEKKDPLRQMLLNSHSPVVLSGLDATDMMFCDLVSVTHPETKTVTRHTRIRPIRPKDQGDLDSTDPNSVTSFEVDRYLQYASESVQ